MRAEKTIEYYKNNAEEDYMTTPISVLRYISELEEYAKQSERDFVKDFHTWRLPNEKEEEMSAEKKLLKDLNKFVEEHDIPEGKVGLLMSLAVRYAQELEHAKQSESKKQYTRKTKQSKERGKISILKNVLTFISS